MGLSASSPIQLLRRLEAAANAHDVEALTNCFAVDYRNETPVHPARGFTGSDQVRRNWTAIFAGVPDLRTRVLRAAVDGDVVWSEWEMAGTRRDGTPHLMRGVVIFNAGEGRMQWARFYLEPVDQGSGDVNAAVQAAVGMPS